MARRFLIKEIALQAGLGVATVDRVLNGRAHVREGTRRRVEQAIRELEKQEIQLATTGRKLLIDVVVEAPTRFSTEIQDALEAELPAFHPAVLRPRFLMRETMTTAEVVETLHSVAKRGSHGVLLKARDVSEISEAIGELKTKGIPVVTMFTDIPLSGRFAYAGLDNRVAGTTAAYLIGQWLRGAVGTVLITISDEGFRGEEEREASFRRALRVSYPNLTLLDASGGHGLNLQTEERMRQVVTRSSKIAAVYSMGGGNTAVLKVLEAAKQNPLCFIGHDLDRDNVGLLRRGKMQAILHHELRQDMRSACQHIMHFHRLIPASAIAPSSSIVVVTPENIPEHIACRLR
ncbi:LacI family DNA-binding transcriptional regulator [Caballeronia sp. AZ7_KS35]|uniref:LacI family DNA-binding transcriptional regulator n=1 Tax=Caballeronia sp. AZ7_KS35 TaxID=2921762 RepID=UPI0020292D8B|nr:LacI family DNA-binding transcriptional regulator [Caballeronia sp. AZ7_KS35]